MRMRVTGKFRLDSGHAICWTTCAQHNYQSVQLEDAMQLKAVPAVIRRHGWVVLSWLGVVGLLTALPVRGEDAREAGGITEQLTLVAPPQMVAARIFSPVTELKVRPH